MTPEEVTREVRRLEITTRHLVRDIVAGEYSSAFRGRGVEFAEVREYQPGDDIRTIDWNVTARLGSAFVKRYLEERELTVVFVVDRSASGGFGSRGAHARRPRRGSGRGARLRGRAQQRSGRLAPRDRPGRVVHPTAQGPAARAPGHQRAAGVRARRARHRPGRGAQHARALPPPPRGHLPRLRLPDRRATSPPWRVWRGGTTSSPSRSWIHASASFPMSAWSRSGIRKPGDWRVVDTSDRASARALQRAGQGVRPRAGADADASGAPICCGSRHGRSYAEPLLAFFRRRERMLWR